MWKSRSLRILSLTISSTCINLASVLVTQLSLYTALTNGTKHLTRSSMLLFSSSMFLIPLTPWPIHSCFSNFIASVLMLPVLPGSSLTSLIIPKLLMCPIPHPPPALQPLMSHVALFLVSLFSRSSWTNCLVFFQTVLSSSLMILLASLSATTVSFCTPHFNPVSTLPIIGWPTMGWSSMLKDQVYAHSFPKSQS